MKYGKRERIVGGIIIIAIAVIVLPMLFGDPEPRDQGPAPTMTIEQPIDVQRENVGEPSSPLTQGSGSSGTASNNTRDSDSTVSQTSQLLPSSSNEQRDSISASGNGKETAPPAGSNQAPSAPSASAARSGNGSDNAGNRAPAGRAGKADNSGSGASDSDPIMAAASHGGAGGSHGGWTVQAGSFGEAGNADRLVGKLKGLGFKAYKKSRNNLQTVYVGPYDSSEAGEQARTQLQQRANIKGLVVRRDGNG